MKYDMKSINARNVMVASVAIFSALALIMIGGMLIALVTGAVIDSGWFNPRTALPTLILVLLLGACLLLPDISATVVFGTIAAVIVATMISVAISPFNNLPIDASMPALLFAMLAVFYRAKKSVSGPVSLRAKLRSVSPHIIHFGIILVLIGVFVSTNTRIDGYDIIRSGETGIFEGQPYTVKITDISSQYEGTPYGEYPGSSYATRIDFQLYLGDRLVDRDCVKYITDFKWGQSYATNYVHRSLTREVFITSKMVEGDLANLYMRTAPWITAVWGGIIIMAIGIITLLCTVGTGRTGRTDRTEEVKNTGRANGAKRVKGAEKTKRVRDDDVEMKYEDMLQRELGRMKKR